MLMHIVIALIALAVGHFLTKLHYNKKFAKLVRSHRIELDRNFTKTFHMTWGEAEQYGRSQERLEALTRNTTIN